MRRSRSLILLLAAGICFAQPVLRLKTRQIVGDLTHIVAEADTPAPLHAGHLILQFAQIPTADTVAELQARGVTVLGAIPENGLLVTLDRRVSLEGLGAIYAEPLPPADKISPLIGRNPQKWNGHFLIELQPDVDPGAARALLLRLGVELQDNPDLAPMHLMIHIADPAEISGTLARVSGQDEVSYIFPASSALWSGVPAPAYASPLTTSGVVTQNIPTYGNGWAGPSHGSATIGYVFSQMTAQLPATQTEKAIKQAMAQWAQVAQLSWVQGTNPGASQTVNIFFATYAHGDGYPFTGPTGVLAHTFYPAPPNPEPIAGDMHFNDSYTWEIGANMDVFSVALHELGHSLGLGHSDDPSDVMYPYYKLVTTLNSGDIAAVQTLYGAGAVSTPSAPAQPSSGGIPAPAPEPTPTPTPAPTPPPAPTPTPTGTKDTTPPTLTITSPGGTTVSTSAAAYNFLGMATDNVAVANVTWRTNTGSSGTAAGTSNWSASIPLLTGSNQVTITATDTSGNSAWRSVVVSRY